MDLIYDLLDELSNNHPTNEQETKNSTQQDDYQHERSGTPQHPTRGNWEEDKLGNFKSYNVDDPSTADAQHPWQTQDLRQWDSRQWDSHTKTIHAEFSNASNPEQVLRISKDLDLDSLPRREGWLKLDDFDLKTSPSEYPPPSRPPPTRDLDSNHSTSRHKYTEGNPSEKAKEQENEQFLKQVSITRRISHELVEEDVYDDLPPLLQLDKQSPSDLIDIFTTKLDSDHSTDKNSSKLCEKVNDKELNRVTKAFKNDLSMLLNDNSTSTISNTEKVADKKGKAIIVEGNGGRTSQKQQPSTAVTEMRERELKRKLEMEEVARAAEELQHKFKNWAAGKERNLRALLSSLQNILGPEFGWQPIPMMDLLEPAAVRKQYKRATLLVHPDKLQQKGASPRQKYIAEQVFGLLIEASRKFNSEELF
ncbi:hypothetical protein R1flu_013633 [Riccia fluitans]|uniref:J domain-containing protein n=1 Tax=Riccia fluitans TaxID=41844 RepID=A0ABD1YGZ1_9MARC